MSPTDEIRRFESVRQMLVAAIEHARDQELAGRRGWCDDRIILDALEASRELPEATEWWITTGPLDGTGGRRPGRKRLGPFSSRELAETVRGYIEKVEGHEGLWVCPLGSLQLVRGGEA